MSPTRPEIEIEHRPIGYDQGRPLDCVACGGPWPCLTEQRDVALLWKDKRAEEISLDLAALVKVRDAVAQAVIELDAEHRPSSWASPTAHELGKEPIGCELCWPSDGSWPCSSRMIADDLRSALSTLSGPQGAPT